MNEASMIVLSMMWVMLSAEPNEVYMGYNYKYNRMMEQCESRAGRACCRSSVRHMQSKGYFPASVKEGCAEGEKMTSLMCPASMAWCEPHVEEQALDGEGVVPIAAKVSQIRENLAK